MGDDDAAGPADGSRAMPRARLAARAKRTAVELRDALELRRDPSYRRQAAGYRLPDGSRRVYLHHLRKTAGTSLFLSFLALGGEDPMVVWHRLAGGSLQRTMSGPYAFASNQPRVLAEGAWFFARSHRSWSEVDLPPRTFTVTVLRDPVRRVHSLYDYLVAGDDPGLPGRVGERHRRWATGGFDAFLDQVPEEHLLNQLATFSERMEITEATDRIASCSAVFFTEQYAEGLKTLGRHLELPLVAQRVRVTGERSVLTGAQEERLRERLEPEYRLLEHLAVGGIAPRT